MASGRDSFSKDSAGYAAARPKYPPGLYDWIASQCRERGVAWDCATGNGQAAVALASRFRRVLATDMSAEQIQHAIPADNITYSVGPAETTGFPEDELDLVTVAQALHWFDLPRFWTEVKRICREGAVFCAWGYAWFKSVPEVDRTLVTPFRALIEPFWARELKVLWDGYPPQDLRMPFPRIEVPEFAIELEWSLSELIAYLKTWSAFKKCQEDGKARAAVDELLHRTRDLVPEGKRFPVRMPLRIVAGRVGFAGSLPLC